MGYALKIYEAFQDLGKEKASILAEFVEYIESQKAATSGELRETELRLQKEIEGVRLEVEHVRKELRETELRLRKEIEGVKLGLQKEIEGVKLGLQKEIEQVRLEVEKVRAELSEKIEKVKADLVKWMFLFWTGQVIALIGILKWFFK